MFGQPIKCIHTCTTKNPQPNPYNLCQKKITFGLEHTRRAVGLQSRQCHPPLRRIQSVLLF